MAGFIIGYPGNGGVGLGEIGAPEAAAAAADQPPQDDFQHFDAAGHDPVAMPGGYQQRDVPPRVQDDEPVFEEYSEDFDAALIEAAMHSAPVAPDQPQQDDQSIFVDDGVDDPIHDLAVDGWPVQPQAPPELPPQCDESIFDDEPDDAWQDESQPVAAAVTPSEALPADDAWHWEDHHDPAAVPGGYQQQNVPPQVEPVEWAWDDEPDDQLPVESAPVVANAAVAEGPRFDNDLMLFDGDDVQWLIVPEVSQQSDGLRNPHEDEWPEDGSDDLWQDDSAPVVADAVAQEPNRNEQAWPLDETDEELPVESAPVVADAVFGEAQQHQDLPLDDEWDEEVAPDDSAPVRADAPAPTRDLYDVDWQWDEAADDTLPDESGPVATDTAPAGRDSYDIDWQWDDAAEDEPLDESSPVGANAVVTVRDIYDVDWQWDDEFDDIEWAAFIAQQFPGLVIVARPRRILFVLRRRSIGFSLTRRELDPGLKSRSMTFILS